jgi:hypothetical protein
MKSRAKMYLCSALAVLALVSAATAGATARGVGQSAGFDGAGSGYVLRDLDGYIAVYFEGFDKAPAAVTDIELRQLPPADREALAEGMHVNSREELLLLLEDLGS